MSDIGGNGNLMGNRQGIRDEIDKRIGDHQDWIMRHPRPTDVSHYPLNILADGDSWFDYPYGGPPLHFHSDIIRKLGGYTKLKGLLVDGSSLLNLAHFGNTSEELMQGDLRERLVTVLGDNANGAFDAILFSGGGNDLAGPQFGNWLVKYDDVGGDVEKGLNETALAAVLTKVRDAYCDLIALRTKLASGVPIFVHAYDFAWPSGIPARCAGPWLRPGLATQGWMVGDEFQAIERGARIVASILSRFATVLGDLAADPANNLVLIPTQAVLDPQTGWVNELHPTPDGFATMAELFVEALAARFPGRPVRATQGLNV